VSLAALFAGTKSAMAAYTPFAGPQAAFDHATEYEVLYGGAKGPGKTHALLFKGFSELTNPNAHFLFLRVDYPSLAEAMDRAQEHFPRSGAVWNEQKKRWTFPSGALYEFGYAETMKDVRRYQGREPSRIKYDEIGQLANERVWTTLLAELRSTDPTLIRQAEASANPGGPGEPWLMQRFVKKCGEDGSRIYVDPQEPTMTRRFIPATVQDNPIYANDAQYMATLNTLPLRQRQQLRDGKWGLGAGRALDELNERMHIVPVFNVPNHWKVWGAYDWGFGHPFSFGWFAKDEDGNVTLVDSCSGHHMLPWEQAQRIQAKAPERARLVVVAGHDAFAKRQAMGVDTPSIADTFREFSIFLTHASIDRIQGLNNFREYLKWQGPDGKTWTPRFRIMDTPHNRDVVFPVLESMMTDPDNPEDALKRDADSDTGAGGDDPYDMVRYGLAFQPAKPHVPIPDHVNPHDPDILKHMQNQTLAQAKAAQKKRQQRLLRMAGGL